MTYNTIVLKTALIAGLAAMPITALAHGNDDNDHVEKTYEFDDFNAIDISGVYDLDVQVGDDYAISTSGHEREMAQIDVYVKNGTLYLARKKGKKKWLKNNKGVMTTISLPSLTALNISGVGEGDIAGIDSDDFELGISGVGELTLSGSCGNLEARISGVGEIDAKKLECKDSRTRLSGVGEMTLYASESVDVKTSGVGAVSVYGKPKKVSKSKGFMSNVTIK